VIASVLPPGMVWGVSGPRLVSAAWSAACGPVSGRLWNRLWIPAHANAHSKTIPGRVANTPSAAV